MTRWRSGGPYHRPQETGRDEDIPPAGTSHRLDPTFEVSLFMNICIPQTSLKESGSQEVYGKRYSGLSPYNYIMHSASSIAKTCEHVNHVPNMLILNTGLSV